jgi:hypothetical protein
MPRRSLLALALTALAVATAPPAPAQPKAPPASPTAAPPQAPTLNPLPPLAARPGAAVELTLTGTNLAGPVALGTSFPAQATFPTDAGNGTDNARLRVRLAVPADAPVGLHTLRLATKDGVSNLRPFCVDDLPQVVPAGSHRTPATAQPLPVPCAAVGQAAPEASDFYRITAKAGQRLTFEVLGRRIGSPIDPILILHDARTGRELPGGLVDDTPGLQTDARLTHTFAQAGDYLIEVRDSTYRGGGEFHYRLRVGDFPCAVTPFPLAVPRGRSASVGFAGPNVAGAGPVAVTAPADPTVEAVTVAPRFGNGPAGWPVTLLFSDHEELTEQEPNNEPAKANRLPVPGGVSGRFQEKGDVDYFVFAAKKGQRYVIAAQTQELLSPAEAYLVLRDAKGAELGKSDPKLPAARIDFAAPADGDYTVSVEHLNYQFGPSEVYRLTVTPAAPAFDVALALDRVGVPPGGAGVLAVAAVTRRGYDGPIELSVAGPKGLSGSVVIPAGPVAPPAAGAAVAFLPVECASDVSPGAYELRVVARPVGGGAATVAGTNGTLSAALNGLPVLPRDLLGRVGVGVIESPPFTLTSKLLTAEAERGKPATVSVKAVRRPGFAEEIALSAAPLPANVAVALKNIPKGADEVQVTLTAAPNAAAPAFPLLLSGSAKVQGRDYVIHAAPVPVTLKK